MASEFPNFPQKDDPRPNWNTVASDEIKVPDVPELNPEMTYAEGFNQSIEYSEEEYLKECPLEESVFKVEIDQNSQGSEAEVISEKYTYRLVQSKSGVDVYQNYLSDHNDFAPKSKECIIFYEYDPEGMDTFGTACMIKMGSERVEFMKKLNQKKKSIKVDSFERTGLKSWSEAIAIHYNNKISDIGMDAKKIETQILLEIHQQQEIQNLFSSFFTLNNKLATYVRGLAGSLEENKLGPNRYERDSKDFKPLIPILEFENTGSSNLTVLMDLIDKTINNPNAIIGKGTSLLLDTIQNAYRIDIRSILKSIFKTVSFLKETIDKIKNGIEESLALVNAFLCGLVNGLNSLIQFVLNILAFVIDNLPILENASEITQETRAKVQSNIEVVEDLIELLVDKIVNLFETIKNSIKSIISGIVAFVDFLGKQLEEKSKYFWAFFIGAIIFELLVDWGLALLTGGTSLIGSIGKYLSKIKKGVTGGLKIALRKSVQFSKNTIEVLKKEIDELIQSLKNGNFKDWLLLKLNDVSKNIKTSIVNFRSKYIDLRLVNISWRTSKNIRQVLLSESSLLKFIAIKKVLKEKNIATSILKITDSRGKVIYSKKYIAHSNKGKKIPDKFLDGFEQVGTPKFEGENFLDYTKGKRSRFKDAENKILRQIDSDMTQLIRKDNIDMTKLNVELKFESAYLPCAVCKREILIRESMYNAKIEFATLPKVYGNSDFLNYSKKFN